MRVLLFRHGIAEQISASGRDEDRELTREGVSRTAAAAAGLAHIADRPQLILTSPKTRARQTAAIAGEVFDLRPVICPPIADGSAADIRDALAQRQESRVMLVGHEPTMSQLIALLVGRPDRRYVFKKAGAALLEAPLRPEEPATPTLHWLIPPRVLRALAM